MIIAEISGNHNGDINRAFALIKAAKDAGADAIKLQTYTADTITINSDKPEFILKGGLWDGKKLYDLYEWAHTPWEWHQSLFEYATELGVTIFSSPFDMTAVDLLEELGCPIYKIASFEAMDLPLIQRVAETGKPLIVSTGVINDTQIEEMIETVYKTNNENLTLLHCISQYPTKTEDFNLNTIPNMKKRFGVKVGLSDHSMNNTAALISIGLGVEVLEKHITLARVDGGPDAGFSLEPEEFKDFVQQSRAAFRALGKVDYSNTDSNNCHRSLYVVEKIKKGEVITNQKVKSIRPGLGLEPK